jgi:DNA-binding transcriptional LysR family regulator
VDFRIRQLQCFLTLSEQLNYGRSARALYISQPTLSFQIKSLEEAFGTLLFERTRQHVRLTPAGFALREYAQSILDTVAAANDHIGSLRAHLRLRIACGPSGQYVYLPTIIRALAKFPEFEFEVIDLTTEQQLTHLPEGKVDALLMVPALPVPGMRFDPLCKESLVAMVSRQSPLANRSSISIHDLRNHNIIASRAQDCSFHQTFLKDLFAPFGITPHIIEAPQSASVQFAYAAAGEGIALTTTSMGNHPFPGVIAIPFIETLPEIQFGLAAMEINTSPAMNIFREVVLREIGHRTEYPLQKSQPTEQVSSLPLASASGTQVPFSGYTSPH